MIFVGIFNILLLFELMSNVGDEDEVEKEVLIIGSEGISIGKRKMFEVLVSGEVGGMDFKKLEFK